MTGKDEETLRERETAKSPAREAKGDSTPHPSDSEALASPEGQKGWSSASRGIRSVTRWGLTPPPLTRSLTDTPGLDGVASDWYVDVYHLRAPELHSLKLFFHAFCPQFGDPALVENAHTDLKQLKQGKEYSATFRTIAAKLPDWPEEMEDQALIHPGSNKSAFLPWAVGMLGVQPVRDCAAAWEGDQGAADRMGPAARPCTINQNKLSTSTPYYEGQSSQLWWDQV